MSKKPERIGFVGVGLMGANMALRLDEVGYQVVSVFDTDRKKAESVARQVQGEVAPTLARVAELSDIILTVVTDDRAMREIFSEKNPDSLLNHAKGRLFVNCATLSPQVHIEIEKQVEARGGQTLEASMASSIDQARAGTLYLMCGGKQEVFERAKPLLEDLSTSLRYIGLAGQASKMKALVNMVMNINTAGLAEGLGLSAALGLDVTMVREVFSQTGAASRVLETDGADMQHRDHEVYFSAAHAAKDSGIAYGLAESVGLTLPLAKATLEQYQRLVKLGKGELDKSGISELTFKDRSSR
ncbi:MAG: NAD(P)-dependent oxidoreductase [Nitrospira sp.]|nr:NAD(P)-dependent oxidoreductase [Nitrospira sp.]